MRRLRREHLKDYELSEDGGYEYRGTLWLWDPPESREGFFKPAWGLLTGATACALAGGFVPMGGVGETFFVLLPYAVVFVALAVSALALYKLMHEGAEVRDYVYHASVEALTPRLVVGLVASVACAIGQAICLVSGLGRLTDRGLGLAYLACMLGCATCLWLLVRRWRTVEFTVAQHSDARTS